MSRRDRFIDIVKVMTDDRVLVGDYQNSLLFILKKNWGFKIILNKL